MVKKKTIVFIIKAVVSTSLLYLIIINIDWHEVSKNLKSANYILLVVAFILNIVERAELTYKWNLLIWIRGIQISFVRLFFINSIGGFWGLFLPSSLGTDVVRGYYLAKNNSAKSITISSIVVDRILGMFSLMLLGVISLFVAGALIPNTNIRFYALFLFVIVTILFYLFQKEKTAFFIKELLKKIKYKKLTEAISKLHFSILEYRKYPKTLILSFLITVLVQITRVLTYYMIALAFNISFPIIYFFLIIPIIMLVIMIPVSIGGLGVREGTFIASFALVGMSMNNAVIISFSNSFINTLVTSLGGIVYLFYNSSVKLPDMKTEKDLILENKPGIGGDEIK
jgi:glycosyltransferase 2 family protein